MPSHRLAPNENFPIPAGNEDLLSITNENEEQPGKVTDGKYAITINGNSQTGILKSGKTANFNIMPGQAISVRNLGIVDLIVDWE